MIQIGDRLPDATLMESTEFGEFCPLSPKPVDVATAAKGKRIAVFGLPGAFTPTCSAQHLPGYVGKHEDLVRAGVDETWCVAVNDAYVMAAWGQAERAIGKVRMLGDGNGDFARKLGLDVDLAKAGLGLRMRRFSMLVEDGVVKQLNVEAPGKFEVSNVETLLGQVG